MDRVGDDSAGFSIGHDPVAGTVRVTAWGFWSSEVAGSYATQVVGECRDKPGAGLVLDMTELKPMRDEGQRAFATVMRSLASLGITRVSIVTTSQMTKLQLVRLASENGASACVHWVSGISAMARNA
jgi:hypothetical protein